MADVYALPNVAYWLGTVLTAPDKQRLLFPRMQTFENRCPLFGEIRPLHPQQQTFLMVSPKVRSWPKGDMRFDELLLRQSCFAQAIFETRRFQWIPVGQSGQVLVDRKGGVKFQNLGDGCLSVFCSAQFAQCGGQTNVWCEMVRTALDGLLEGRNGRFVPTL